MNDNKAAGRKPVYVAVSMHDGKPNFSAIFAKKPAGSFVARHDMTRSGYQSEWTTAPLTPERVFAMLAERPGA